MGLLIGLVKSGVSVLPSFLMARPSALFPCETIENRNVMSTNAPKSLNNTSVVGVGKEEWEVRYLIISRRGGAAEREIHPTV